MGGFFLSQVKVETSQALVPAVLAVTTQPGYVVPSNLKNFSSEALETLTMT